MKRREMLKFCIAAAAVAGYPSVHLSAAEAIAKGKDKIHQSVSLWCFNGYLSRNKMSFEDFILFCKKTGLEGIDLLTPGQFELMAKHGMVCTMTSCNGIPNGFNDRQNHESCIKNLKAAIDQNAKFNFPNVIAFSGNCRGKSKEEGLEICVEGLKKVVGYAEEKKVTICMEYLNSKGHKDYMCDQTKWAVELVKRVGSERFKILYDIFHADMMEENILEDIKNNYECFGHYHTAGYPGRNEIDARQKRDYHEVMEVIYKTGYTGYVAHEFVPRDADALASLENAYKICNID